jgi:hypothetical protein
MLEHLLVVVFLLLKALPKNRRAKWDCVSLVQGERGGLNKQ